MNGLKKNARLVATSAAALTCVALVIGVLFAPLDIADLAVFFIFCMGLGWWAGKKWER